jgi:hypothetical protein
MINNIVLVIRILGHFLSRFLYYPMHIHLFLAEDLILLFNCISQFLGKVLLAGPRLIILSSTRIPFQFEDLTRNIALERLS